jgi:hypothetical protein
MSICYRRGNEPWGALDESKYSTGNGRPAKSPPNNSSRNGDPAPVIPLQMTATLGYDQIHPGMSIRQAAREFCKHLLHGSPKDIAFAFAPTVTNRAV